jgi:hypothetical protein
MKTPRLDRGAEKHRNSIANRSSHRLSDSPGDEVAPSRFSRGVGRRDKQGPELAPATV